jgi:Na+-driven multidrug efflux pump
MYIFTDNNNRHQKCAVASIIGSIIAISLITFRQYVLSTGFYVTKEALPAASSYLSIRAISVPATLASYVGTGACLGMGDTVTPLIGIAAASLANVFGDWFLICALPFGVAGAAAATAASSYIG